MTKSKRNLLSIMALAISVGGTFFSASQPVHSVSNVVLQGQAANVIALYAGAPNASPLTSAPGIIDGTFAPLAADTADGFTETCNFGTLSNGDGTNSVARVTLRERGNSNCSVRCSVSSYTATNISYAGTALTGGPASQLTMITLGNMPASAGAQGNTTGFSYGPRFTSGADTLATLNGGVTAAVDATKDRFVAFTTPPSRNGNLNSANNYVENTATFSVPTGFAWQSTGAGSAWSATVSFMITATP